MDPRDVAEIEDAARNGRLEETPSSDAKRELPATAKKNAELAVDHGARETKRQPGWWDLNTVLPADGELHRRFHSASTRREE